MNTVKSWYDKKESKICESNNPRKLYAYTNKRFELSKAIPTTIDSDTSKTIFEKCSKASAFYEYLSSALRKDDGCLPHI